MNARILWAIIIINLIITMVISYHSSESLFDNSTFNRKVGVFQALSDLTLNVGADSGNMYVYDERTDDFILFFTKDPNISVDFANTSRKYSKIIPRKVVNYDLNSCIIQNTSLIQRGDLGIVRNEKFTLVCPLSNNKQFLGLLILTITGDINLNLHEIIAAVDQHRYRIIRLLS